MDPVEMWRYRLRFLFLLIIVITLPGYCIGCWAVWNAPRRPETTPVTPTATPTATLTATSTPVWWLLTPSPTLDIHRHLHRNSDGQRDAVAHADMDSDILTHADIHLHALTHAHLDLHPNAKPDPSPAYERCSWNCCADPVHRDGNSPCGTF